MFDDRQTALKVRETLLSVDALLTRSIHLVMSSDSTEAEKKNYSKFVGQLTATIFIDALGEIFESHPDLMPARYKAILEGKPDPGWKI